MAASNRHAIREVRCLQSGWLFISKRRSVILMQKATSAIGWYCGFVGGEASSTGRSCRGGSLREYLLSRTGADRRKSQHMWEYQTFQPWRSAAPNLMFSHEMPDAVIEIAFQNGRQYTRNAQFAERHTIHLLNLNSNRHDFLCTTSFVTKDGRRIVLSAG